MKYHNTVCIIIIPYAQFEELLASYYYVNAVFNGNSKP